MTFHRKWLHRLVLLVLPVLFCHPGTLPAAADGLPALRGGPVPAERRIPATDTAFTGLDGEPRNLADFRGRTLLVNFWASWCAPCLREMPALDRLRQALDGEDFHILAISVDTNAAVARNFLEQRLGLPDLPSYHDARMRLARALDVSALPATLILDRQGRIAYRHDGPAAWDSDSAIRLIRQVMAAPE